MSIAASAAYRVLGQEKVAREFTDAHCQRLAMWFAPDGRFVHVDTPPSSREWQWNGFSNCVR